MKDQAIFGAGLLWGKQTVDAFGNPLTNATPILFGTLQNISVDMSFDTKELYGSGGQFAIATGRGKGKIECKAQMGTIKGAIFDQIFFGQGSSAGNGLLTANYDTIGEIIPSGSTHTITVTPASSGVFTKDLGVINAETAIAFNKVATSPAVGEYSVDNSGVYTFNASDANTKVFINYEYSVAGAVNSSRKMIKNIAMGAAPFFECDLYLPYNSEGTSLILSFKKCMATKLSIATKLDDFSLPEIDFTCLSTNGNDVFEYSLSKDL